MRLSELCQDLEFTCVRGSMDVEVTDVVYDSRKVLPGMAFVCVVGAVTDGHRFIPAAVDAGATALVVERPEEAADVPEGVTVVQVPSARRALALMAAAHFGYPDRKLVTIGVTGTKGKTTTTHMVKQVLDDAGLKVGLIGSNGSMICDEHIPSRNTTPESYEIHRLFAQMVEAGCTHVVMEVSSQGLKLDRTAGITFDIGVFTNFSPDHIGPAEHASLEEYLDCKRMLFRQCRIGVVNADDEKAPAMLDGATCERIVTLAEEDETGACRTELLGRPIDLRATDVTFLREDGQLGMSFQAHGLMEREARVHIPGRFSVSNALVTMAVCHLLGMDDDVILKGLLEAQVKGRVEMLPNTGDFNVIIDYAHNELSTRSVLQTLRAYGPSRLIAVFGCGGNRSKLRRYDIGEVAGELADLCVLTMDNPRSEEVADINADIKVGLARSDGRYVEIEDRAEAIAWAVRQAQPGDMIVLLGKGHEDYQEIKGVKYHFDEREAVAAALAGQAAKA